MKLLFCIFVCMSFLYDIIIFKTKYVLLFLAFFNKKINLFVKGRKETFLKIAPLNGEKTIWFHAASLGEFEQAIPVIEEIKKTYRTHKILVTFFSPSGYEIRKNYKLADVVCYLPLDSKSNAKKFIETINPTIVIFIKYEFWPNLLNELYKKEVKTILVSGILREKQLFFKKYGGFMRKSLNAFDYFFVQDEKSKTLLNSINLHNVTIAGDTRFDRVFKILEQDNFIDCIDEFKNKKYTIVAGSTWAEDEELLVDYINNHISKEEKVIIAPHNIKCDAILDLQKTIHKKTILFSTKADKKLADYQVFVIDTIGILTKIYAAADVAYVGGGLKTGLHNILEPATFGIPVVIGNKYDKFKEAVDLVKIGGCISISNQQEFSDTFLKLKEDESFRNLTGNINKRYIQDNLGATTLIMNYLKNKI